MIHIVAIVLAVLAVNLLLKISSGCLIREITGIPCPACGLTRAAFSLMRFDFAAAWYNNPGIFILPVAVMLTLHLPLFEKRKPIITFILLLLFAFIVIYAVRLAFFTIP